MNQEQIVTLEQAILRGYENTTGIVVRQGGVTIYEKYFDGYTKDDAVHVASVTKSVISALYGIAIEKGYIHSLDQKVLEFFPDYAPPQGERAIHDITLRHLLTMTAPHKYAEEPFEAFFASDNWLEMALSLLGGENGLGVFRYAAIVGSHILSGVLTNATGQPILAFANENLFAPLGIDVGGNVELKSKEEHIAFFQNKDACGWVVDPQGLNTPGWGLFLTPMDMAKIGQVYVDGGRYNGEQIVPAWWIDESTREQSRWEEMGLAYGYLWWVLDGAQKVYAAMGDGGNVIYVNTAKQLVISMGGVFVPDAKDRIELIQRYVEAVVE